MDHTSTYEAYLIFRMSEPDNTHTPAWIEASANPEYEKFIHQEYMGTF